MAGHDPPDTKGKSKEKSTDDIGSSKVSQNTADAATTATTDDSPSVFSRIAQSAAGLSRDLITARPSGGDLASLSSPDKDRSAGSGQPSSAAASGESAATNAFPGRVPSSANHAQQHANAQDEAFSQFLDGVGIDMSMPAEPVIGLDDGGSHGHGADLRMESAWTALKAPQASYLATDTTPQRLLNEQQPSSAAVAQQESRDGLDVVQLLAADGPLEDEPDYDDIELAEDEIAGLKRALFGDNETITTTTSQDWDSVLNFIPDFVRPNPYAGGYGEEELGGAPATAAAVSTKSRETRAALGLAHSAESTRLWLDQWHDVLTRYDDEVWGGLSPLVAEAREEVNQLQQSDTAEPIQPPADTKALDRLRQILGHLREDC